MDRLLAWLGRHWNRRVTSRKERLLARTLESQKEDTASLARRLTEKDEELEAERVKVRILQLEVDHLAALYARNLERVRLEMEVHDER